MFVLGILNIITGGLVIISHIFKDFEYVTHATENLLIILIGSVFLCTGFILLGISFITKSFYGNVIKNMGNDNLKSRKPENNVLNYNKDDMQYEPWTCRNCGTKNPVLNTSCTKCGAKKL